MKCLVSMFIVLGLLSPLYGENVIIYEDFEGASPGTLLNTLPGWSGPNDFVISADTIDQGQSLDCAAGTSSWPRITQGFSYEPSAGESYVFSGTLWVGGASAYYAHAQLRVADGSRLWVGLGYGDLMYQYEFAGVAPSSEQTIRIPMVHNQDGSIATMDFKLVITGDSFDGYWRVNGDEDWIDAGHCANGIDMADFVQLDLYGNSPYAGRIDTISLKAVPEPSVVMLVLIGLASLIMLRKRG